MNKVHNTEPTADFYVRVFKYGVHPPKENADLVTNQMLLAHRYRNELTRVELDRRTAHRALTSADSSVSAAEAEVSDLVDRIKEARDAIKIQRASTRSRSDTESQREQVKHLVTAKVEAISRLKAARAALKSDDGYLAHLKFQMKKIQAASAKEPSKKLAAEEKKFLKKIEAKSEEFRKAGRDPEAVKAEISPRHSIDDVAAEKARQARAACGLHWGTYLLVEDAAKSAFKSVTDPKFLRWSGDGHVGIHVQGRQLLCSAIFQGDTFVRIDPVSASAWDPNTRRGDRRRQSRTTLHMRVGPKDDARFASWDMIMHRSLPEGGEITHVTVSRKKVGPKCQWSTEITVRVPNARVIPATAAGAVAVHFGWLATGSGLRVAIHKDEQGRGGDLVLTQGPDINGHGKSIIDGLKKVDDLKSIRSKKMNEAIERLCRFLTRIEMPEWMLRMTVRKDTPTPSQAQAINYLSGWRSQARLASFIRVWKNNRFQGDEQAFLELEGDGTKGPGNTGWRYNDHHLWQYEVNMRQQILLQRREIYRRFAHRLAVQYETCIIDDTDYRDIAKRNEAEEPPEAKRPRSNRQIASVSELRLVIRNAFSQPGRLVTIKARGVSMTCPECGAEHPAHKSNEEHEFVCSMCTFRQDIDGAALLNILRRGGCGKAVDRIIEASKKLERKLHASKTQAYA